MIKWFLLGCFACSSLFAEDVHFPIIYLISPPRSLSTAFTHMIQERGDFEIFHEPSMYAYDKIHYPEYAKKTYRSDSFESFDEVKRAVLAACKKRPVFVKEMSFAVVDALLKDPEFIQNEKIWFVFLVRNPHHSIISFYNKLQMIPEGFDTLVGVESLFCLYEALKCQLKNPPVLIRAEELYTNPYASIKALCEMLQIPFMAHALSWERLGDAFDSHEAWHELKQSIDDVQHWHGDAITSTHFTKPTSYEVDDNGMPTFSEIVDPIHKKVCIAAWRSSVVFWEKLKSHPD